MTYGDPWQQQQQQQGDGDFPRGRPPPPPPPTMQNPSASSATLNRYSHHPILPDDAHGDNFAEKRMRRLNQRRTVDYTSTVVRYMQIRMWQRDSRDRTVLQPTPAAAIDMLSTAAYSDNPSSSFAAKFVYTAFRKENRCSINRVLWTPTGRHLITGSQRGEFTLWNGQSFKVEMNFQAHDQAIRSMVWSHNDNWMVSGDDKGTIRYWENNMKNVKAFSAHKESVHDLSFCRTDLKFCSCSDDATIRIWDFARCQEERSLTGHGWDVKSVDWHPTKSLLVSGGKDKVVKLWDAKTGRELCSFHGHKNTVLCVKWNQNGNWLLTSSKDQIIKLYDLRAMKELESFSGHQKDVTALAWHPFHEEYFVSGSYDGSIFHWLVGDKRAMVAIPNAHNFSVWDVAWHPMGHLLCSGSNDHTTKFWCRNRPGDTGHDKFSMGQNQAAEGKGPGWFASGISNNEGTIPGVGVPRPLWMPSIDVSSQRNQKQPVSGSMPFVAPPLPPGLHPLLANQQQGCQQNPEQMPQQQYQAFPQKMTPLPMPALNAQLQPPSHIPMLPHHHLSYPPLQMPALGMPSAPSSTPGMLPPGSSMPTSHPVPMPGQLGMQGSINQIGPSIPQGHFMGWNPMQGAPPGERSPFGFPNMHGPSNRGGGQMYQFGGAFIGAQPGQMPMMPGFNPYQSGDQFGLPPPQPPGPPNHGQTPQ